MNRRLQLLKRVAPRIVKLRLLDELARATAAGFGSAPPRWTSGSLDLRLEEYARFTADQAERVLETRDHSGVEAVKHDLRKQSTELGAKVRGWLRLRRPSDVVETLTALYGYIGIDMSTGAAGEIVVRRCLFASYFSAPVCEIVGALDEGLAAGLSGGGRLEFVERITDGAVCCRARFDMGWSAR